MRGQHLFGNISKGLSVNSYDRAAIQLTMIRRRKRLPRAIRKHSPQLNVAPRCEATLNPKDARILTISAPDKTLGFGMNVRFGF